MQHLILASSFNRFAGPNNNLLDLCNYLHKSLGVDFAVLTNTSKFDQNFLSAVQFPLLSLLRGRPADPVSRLAYSPANVGAIRTVMNAYGLKRDNLYVNSSIDTLFEACAASGGRVIAGHNVITAGFVAPGTDNFLGLLDRIAARLAVRRIIATTDYQKQIYSELGIPEQTITVIPSCLDMSSVHDLLRATEGHSGNDGKPVIFYGGRMEPDKGIRELLLAYRELVKTVPATLKLLGDGSLRAWVYRMKQRIEQESNNASVSFSGRWESREVVLREMSNADVVVLPSYHEMCPVSLIEAMCLSKAAVCTAVGGPKRMVTSQVDGLLVRPFQVTELLEAISALLLDASLRRKLGTNAFETFKRSYDVSVVAPKFKHFLENS